MQLYIKSFKNKIFLALTALLAISIFVVIKECSYPLILHSDLFKKMFVSNSSEKLFYNLSLSYIAAYFFYMIQIYIPDLIQEKKALQILSCDLVNELRLVREFSFLINSVIKESTDATILYNKNITTIFYKEYDCNSCMLRCFSKIDTLRSTMNDIATAHLQIESSRYYYDLDSSVIYIHSLLPVKKMESVIDCINYSLQTKSKLQLTSDNTLTMIYQFINNMQKVLPKNQEVFLEQCNDITLLRKYREAFQASNLDEYHFALTLNENPYNRNNIIT